MQQRAPRNQSLARRLSWLLRQVSELEDTEPYVDTFVLESTLCRRPGRVSLSPEDLRWLLEMCVSQRLLFTEARQRYDRDSRALVPTRLYRVNYQHPRARTALGLED